MRIRQWALLVAFVTAMMAGCATTPREQYADVQDAYISAVQVLTEAREAGEFTEEEWADEILPFINLGDRSLDAIDEATQSGAPTTAPLEQLTLVIAELRPFVIEYLSKRE